MRCVGRWFKGRLLTFAVGYNAAFVQLFGSAAAFYFLPLLGSAQQANWVTAGVCAISFLANIVYVSLTPLHLPTSPLPSPPSTPPSPPPPLPACVDRRRARLRSLEAGLRGVDRDRGRRLRPTQ